MNRLREEYIDTGKLQFVYKQYAILGPESVRAAEATECAADQGYFWEMHDELFLDLASRRTTYNETNLTEFADGLGLDIEQFSQCLSEGKYSDTIAQDRASIQSLGVRGTPAFLINGVYVSGAQPYEVFQEIIEEQLAAAEVN